MRRKLASQRQSGPTHSAGSLLDGFQSIFDLHNSYGQLVSLVNGRGMYLEQLPRRREDGERCGVTISERYVHCTCRPLPLSYERDMMGKGWGGADES